MIKDKIIECKFSNYQLNILESCIENTLGDDFFNENDKLIAEVLLEDIKDLK